MEFANEAQSSFAFVFGLTLTGQSFSASYGMRLSGSPLTQTLSLLLSAPLDNAMREDRSTSLVASTAAFDRMTRLAVFRDNKEITSLEIPSCNAVGTLRCALTILPVVQLLVALGQAPLHHSTEKGLLRTLLEYGLRESEALLSSPSPQPLPSGGGGDEKKKKKKKGDNSNSDGAILVLNSTAYDFTCDGTPHRVYLCEDSSAGTLGSCERTMSALLQDIHQGFVLLRNSVAQRPPVMLPDDEEEGSGENETTVAGSRSSQSQPAAGFNTNNNNNNNNNDPKSNEKKNKHASALVTQAAQARKDANLARGAEALESIILAFISIKHSVKVQKITNRDAFFELATAASVGLTLPDPRPSEAALREAVERLVASGKAVVSGQRIRLGDFIVTSATAPTSTAAADLGTERTAAAAAARALTPAPQGGGTDNDSKKIAREMLIGLLQREITVPFTLLSNHGKFLKRCRQVLGTVPQQPSVKDVEHVRAELVKQGVVVVVNGGKALQLAKAT